MPSTGAVVSTGPTCGARRAASALGATPATASVAVSFALGSAVHEGTTR